MRCLIPLLLMSALVLGCRLTTGPGLVTCPLPANEQAAKVLEVAPLGTARQEVLKRLAAAGIQGNFGSNESIYYCDFWKQDKETRWHINVQLLFDENGLLYATRPDLAPGIEGDAARVKSVVPANADDPFIMNP